MPVWKGTYARYFWLQQKWPAAKTGCTFSEDTSLQSAELVPQLHKEPCACFVFLKFCDARLASQKPRLHFSFTTWCHQRNVAAHESCTYCFQFCTVGGDVDVPSIFLYNHCSEHQLASISTPTDPHATWSSLVSRLPRSAACVMSQP